MNLSIETDILGIIALCFTIFLAKKNAVNNYTKNMIYISAAVAVIVLLFLEIGTILMGNSDNDKWVVFYRLANVIGFSISPLVLFLILCFNKKENKQKFYGGLLAIPFYINAFLCILSYKTGWIFFVNDDNQYTRGNLFLFPLVVSTIYFILIVLELRKNNSKAEKDDKNVFKLILLLPLLGVVLQVLFEDLVLIWISVAVSLMFYYIILRELQFKYDVQTGIKNRSAFEKEMEKHIKNNKNAGIVVLDINNLKSNNDQHGHKAGDEAIYIVAKIIKESFQDVGRAYRIGGDEFCVICSEISIEVMDQALINLDGLLLKANQCRNIKIVLAYGYAFYKGNESENVYSTLAQADQAMYLHKSKLKESSIKTK